MSNPDPRDLLVRVMDFLETPEGDEVGDELYDDIKAFLEPPPTSTHHYEVSSRAVVFHTKIETVEATSEGDAETKVRRAWEAQLGSDLFEVTFEYVSPVEIAAAVEAATLTTFRVEFSAPATLHTIVTVEAVNEDDARAIAAKQLIEGETPQAWFVPGQPFEIYVPLAALDGDPVFTA